MIDYVVRIALPDPATRDAVLAWLRGHVPVVVAAGAVDGTIVREDGGPPYVLEARYGFASRAAFERYEREEAPRLRVEAPRLFPTAVFTRRLGELVDSPAQRT